MKRLFLILLALGGCAIDDPATSSEESATTSIWGTQGFEVEAGSISGSVHRVSDVTAASGGAYLSFDGPGYVRFFLNIATSDFYNVWARVKAPTQSSVDITMDGSTTLRTFDVMPDWTWVHVSSVYGATRSHTFRMDVETPGLLVDRIVMSPELGFTPITTLYEAETGSLVYPMTTGFQRLPITTYVWSPTGSGSGGELDLDVRVPTSGKYYGVLVRANAQSTMNNTIAVGTNGSVFSSCEVPLTSTTGYTWSSAPSPLFDTVSTVLTIRATESGVKIDKILITNDSGFNLIESSPPLVNSL